MREIFLILKKEFKNFMKREAMVKWYVLICCMNILFTIVPGWDLIPFSRNKALFAFTMMLFSVFLVPNTLSLDIIGGEKYHKTLETIISTPIRIRTLLYGKTLFILLLGFVSLVSITIIDNLILKLIYNTSFLNMGLGMMELIIMYGIVLNAILIIGLLGSILSLIIKNLKLSGYILTLVNIAIIYFVFLDFTNMNCAMLWKDLIILSGTSLILLISVSSKISKQKVMKYLK